MRRRSFLLTATACLAGPSSGLAATALRPLPPLPADAAARIGLRLAAILPPGERDRLMAHAEGPTLPPARRIAADHRTGRTLCLHGVVLSETEAAWCLMLAAHA